MAQSAPPAGIEAELPGHSTRGDVLVLKRSGPIDRPVSLAGKLKAFGLGLSAAHKVLNRIVADEIVTLELRGADRAVLIAELAELGVLAE